MSEEFEVRRFEKSMSKEWNEFVAKSKNATFLFIRDYMDYHSDRFEDHSLLFFKNGKLRALFPGCKIGDDLYSHAGLTYGGLLSDNSSTTEDTLIIFKLLADYAKDKGFKRIHYKPVPHIYHKLPAEEDLYALFRFGARLDVRNVSAAIDTSNMLKFRDIRKHGVKKALRAGIEIKESTDYKSFWDILSLNLNDKYGAKPVHSLEEMTALAKAFPENIKLFTAVKDEETLGGTVCFITPETVHTQYISASKEGKENGALDLLFAELINRFSFRCRYFDFGTSNEDGGRILNSSLIYQKEGFGARAVCYDSYVIDL